MPLVENALDNCALRARDRLTKALADSQLNDTVWNRFIDVSIAVPLLPPLVMSSRGTEDGKRILDPELTFGRGKCVVFAAGLADNTKFEQEMEMRHGCEVHGFDCTVPPTARWLAHAKFHFHPVCIGRLPPGAPAVKTSREYAHSVSAYSADNFKPFRQLLAELKHTARPVDLFKFDIEGFEWDLVEKELLPLPTHLLPLQLSFELHTREAPKRYVPPALVRGKGRREVAQLILALMDRGYRTLSKVLNEHAPQCAEIVMVRSMRDSPGSLGVSASDTAGRRALARRVASRWHRRLQTRRNLPNAATAAGAAARAVGGSSRNASADGREQRRRAWRERTRAEGPPLEYC